MRPLLDVFAELRDRERLMADGRGEFAGHGQCIDDMIESCSNDPAGLISIIQNGTSDEIETVAGFFEDVACLPDGAEWMKQIEEAVKGKETEDILNQIAFAKTCIPA